MAMGVIHLLPVPRPHTPLLDTLPPALPLSFVVLYPPGEVRYACSLLIQSDSLSLYRNRVSNLLLTSVLPGPKEQSPDEPQRFLRPMVNALIHSSIDSLLPSIPAFPDAQCANKDTGGSANMRK